MDIALCDGTGLCVWVIHQRRLSGKEKTVLLVR